ncbi:MAG: ABC transporter ATP-binding protein [Cyanobacteria bacterium SIG30]|nr:ABC transporter ATP-binding protein [Cyanobacteria bacterium SIG30]
MNECILKINNLTLDFEIKEKYYRALDNINLTFKRGKTHALVGESGCGKTMTAMSVLKLLPNNAKIISGEIFYNDKNLLDFDDKQMQEIRGQKIALIPQDPMTSLNPLYTIENQLIESITLNNKISKNKAKELAYDALKEVDIKNIDNVLKSYPHELSGGMKQRIIIAMALLTDAEIIIADEPTTALDVTIQAQILNLLDKIKKQNKTIILITHNLGIVSEYCDDVCIMYSGKIVEQSETKELFKNPKHPYTKALINAIPKEKNKKLENIKGQPKTITEKISGCYFNPRCNKAFDKCKVKNPELVNVNNNSKVACLLYLE